MDDEGMHADEFEDSDPVDVSSHEVGSEGNFPAESQVVALDVASEEPPVSDQEVPEPDAVDAEPVSEPQQATLDEMVASIAADVAASEAGQDDGADHEEAADEPPAEEAPIEESLALEEPSAVELPADEPPAGQLATPDDGSEPVEVEDFEEAVVEAETADSGDAAEGSAADEAVVAVQADSEPEPAAEPVPAPEPVVPRPLPFQLWTRVPLWVEFAVFVGFAGALTYLLWSVPRAALTTLPLYSVLVLGGTALVVIDLATGLAIWLSARSRATDAEKVGLGRILWTRALGWTAGCVAVWWIAFLVLDLHRIGVFG